MERTGWQPRSDGGSGRIEGAPPATDQALLTGKRRLVTTRIYKMQTLTSDNHISGPPPRPASPASVVPADVPSRARCQPAGLLIAAIYVCPHRRRDLHRRRPRTGHRPNVAAPTHTASRRQAFLAGKLGLKGNIRWGPSSASSTAGRFHTTAWRLRVMYRCRASQAVDLHCSCRSANLVCRLLLHLGAKTHKDNFTTFRHSIPNTKS
jgi:hypothetical protein